MNDSNVSRPNLWPLVRHVLSDTEMPDTTKVAFLVGVARGYELRALAAQNQLQAVEARIAALRRAYEAVLEQVTTITQRVDARV